MPSGQAVVVASWLPRSGRGLGPRDATVQVAYEANTDNVALLYACRPPAKPGSTVAPGVVA
jgi:hypothetical protein